MKNDLDGQIRELIDRGAPPVSPQEVTGRYAPARRTAGRHRRLITVAAGVATAGCAAGLAIAFASPGAPPRPAAQAGSAGKAPTFLTAAMVRHVASASSSALESSGREQISYRSVKNGTVTSAGLDTVTYSGSNWNYAVSITKPLTVSGTIRAVDGHVYLQVVSETGWLPQSDSSTTPEFPEAATLLRLLSPAASFQDAGTDVINGQRLTHLHATQLSGLPRVTTLVRYANLSVQQAPESAGTLTGLDVWADSAGVVHQMKILLQGISGQTTVTVTFTDIGQPQSITVPPAR